jgi:RNA polymerase sigma-70 factor (ECF subfamily)
VTRADTYQLKPLLERARAGDAAAWNDFFARVRPYLFAVVHKVLGPDAQHRLDYSNIVQSSLRRIWDHLDDVNQDALTVGRMLAWIERIVRNRSIDAVRRPPVEKPGGSHLDDLAERRPWEQERERDRRAALLAAALARLPERDRAVVELFWFDGLPDEEIHRRLGLSVGAIRVMRLRALRKLRGLMGDAHDDQR